VEINGMGWTDRLFPLYRELLSLPIECVLGDSPDINIFLEQKVRLMIRKYILQHNSYWDFKNLTTQEYNKTMKMNKPNTTTQTETFK